MQPDIVIALILSSPATTEQLNNDLQFPNHILCCSASGPVCALPSAWNRAVFSSPRPNATSSVKPSHSPSGWTSPFFGPLSFYACLFCGISFSLPPSGVAWTRGIACPLHCQLPRGRASTLAKLVLAPALGPRTFGVRYVFAEALCAVKDTTEPFLMVSEIKESGLSWIKCMSFGARLCLVEVSLPFFSGFQVRALNKRPLGILLCF